MKITITKELEDWWATPEQFAEMPDVDIIDLVKEDLPAFVEGADWIVGRNVNEQLGDC